MFLCRAILFTLFLLTLTACAPQKGKTQSDIERLTTGVNDLRSIQAEQVAQIDSLRTEIRTLSGRLDEIEHARGMGGGTVVDIPVANSDDSQGIRTRGTPAIVPLSALEEDEQRADLFPEGAGDKFLEALTKIREGKFQAASALLEEVIDVSHSSSAAPYALFWLGLCEEGSGDNSRAVKHYAELNTRSPKHTRTPLALYRQASVLIRLGDSKAAKFTFKKLIADFPKSMEASKAKDRLKDL